MVAFPRGRACLAPSLPAAVVARQEAVSTALSRPVAAGAPPLRARTVGPALLAVAARQRWALPVVAQAVSDVLPLTVLPTRVALVDSSTGQTYLLPTTRESSTSDTLGECARRRWS